ncbi:zinc ribbon domain-containing protein [Pendulispora rubella]|uniref:Zinc ribbon domain-containing protein n=1 Tax=Pendulispora rubella TaxID=2741070 RepID=A0ABZ2L853_9BACT
MQVNERDRLAHLLLAEMKRWEAGDPEHVGVPQCLDWGTRWVLERAVGVAPLLANMIAKSAYRQLLRDKIEQKLGLFELGHFLKTMSDDARRLDKQMGMKEGLDKWWDDVDYEYEKLFKKAWDSGALDIDVALKLYQRKPKPKSKAKATPLTEAPPTPDATTSEAPSAEAIFRPPVPACPGCSMPNDPDAVFCKRCRYRLDGRRSCHGCETINDSDASFCKKCGADLTSA